LRFVERDLMKVMEIGEKVCVRGGGTSTLRKDLTRPVGKDEKAELKGKEDREVFEIMANVVWAEFGRAIMDELGGVVFAAGRPDEFRKVVRHKHPSTHTSANRNSMIAPRNYTSVHTRTRIPCSIRPLNRSHAFASCVCGVRAAVAAPCILPVTVEGDCE
jgi:hypothetical protein